MSPSDQCYEIIKRFEGLELEAYPDPATGGDPWTVGYGHTGPEVKQGYSINRAMADAYLVKDVQRFADVVNDAVTVELTQAQFDALVSFCYNVGPANFRKSTMLQKINAGDFLGAANEFPKWNRAAGSVMAGLTRRREAERSHFMLA